MARTSSLVGLESELAASVQAPIARREEARRKVCLVIVVSWLKWPQEDACGTSRTEIDSSHEVEPNHPHVALCGCFGYGAITMSLLAIVPLSSRCRSRPRRTLAAALGF